MIIIGIDPGLKGGFAVLDDGELVDAGRLPVVNGEISVALLSDLSEIYRPAIVAIEVQQARPRQKAVLKTGKGWGMLIGYFTGRGHRVIHVRSQDWKPTFKLTRKPKEASRQEAIRLWPDWAGVAFTFKADEGVAEAALIAEHIWRNHDGLG